MIEFILGDLREEFGLHYRERGPCQARLWYMRQLLLSLPQLVNPLDILRALPTAAALILLDRLWCLVYSLIPLKDGLERAPCFLAANIICACLSVAVSGPPVLWSALSAALAVALADSAEPPVYICLTLVCVPATSLITARIRRAL